MIVHASNHIGGVVTLGVMFFAFLIVELARYIAR